MYRGILYIPFDVTKISHDVRHWFHFRHLLFWRRVLLVILVSALYRWRSLGNISVR